MKLPWTVVAATVRRKRALRWLLVRAMVVRHVILAKSVLEEGAMFVG